MAATGNEAVTLEQLKSWGSSVLNGGGGGATLLWSGSSTSTVTIDSLQDYSLIVCLLYDFDGGGNMTFAIGAPNGRKYLPPSSIAASPITIGPTSVSAGSFQLNYVYGIK